MPALPVVLSFSGHDPSGGAGIQADAEAIASHNCHATSVITVLTEQDTQNVTQLAPQNPDHLVSQAKRLMADIPVKAIKIGLLGYPEVITAIHNIIKQNPHIPVIFDPVLAAGGGTDLASQALIDSIREYLLPFTTVITPNSVEARRLSGLKELTECGLYLLEKGCKYVLITGTHEDTADVCNRLYHDGRCIDNYQWKRLPYSYHGSGCTLAAAIAALVASGVTAQDAIAKAQEYTWNTLKFGYQPGKGQHIPNRFYWAGNR